MATDTDIPGSRLSADLAADRIGKRFAPARPHAEPWDTVALEHPIQIAGDMIRLGQLLKLAGVVSGGADAKGLIASGQVIVNGEPELRRGRQLHPGDVVRVADADLRIVAA